MSAADEIAFSRLRKAVDLLEQRFHPGVILLFGSHASGQPRPDSNVELAMLFGEPSRPDPFDLARSKTDLEALLGRNVDLVVLNEASPILAMQSLRHGKILAEVDPDRLPVFAMHVTGAYHDLKRTRRPIEEALLAS